MRKKKRKSNSHAALKLDIMKAYDRVEWSYLEAVMKKIGISHRFVTAIMRCVTLVSFSVLFNGGKLDYITPTQGLRQGDPISPYLFLLVAEGLSCLLKANEAINLTRGLKVAAQAP